MGIFEAGMMICFGISWPFAIAKTVKTKNVTGVSLLFLSLVFLGYVFGTIHKFINNPDWVTILYIYNGILLLTQITLYFIYSKRQPKCQ